jgi:hypothetical protein
MAKKQVSTGSDDGKITRSGEAVVPNWLTELSSGCQLAVE